MGTAINVREGLELWLLNTNGDVFVDAMAQNPGRLVFQKNSIDPIFPLWCIRNMPYSLLYCDRISGYV